MLFDITTSLHHFEWVCPFGGSLAVTLHKLQKFRIAEVLHPVRRCVGYRHLPYAARLGKSLGDISTF